MSSEYRNGLVLSVNAVTVPSLFLSYISFQHPSLPGQPPDLLRQETLLGLPEFFDHAGNLVNGSVGAMLVVGTGTLINQYVRTPQHPRDAILCLGVGAMAASSGVNIAYEAGMDLPFYTQKIDQTFDSADAAYGSVAGALFSLVFCIGALRQKSNNKKTKSKGL